MPNDTPPALPVAALTGLLAELFDGATATASYMLNGGDPGFLAQMESIDARTASARPMPGQTTIAAHVDHVLYGIDLLNRWSAGEPNPWANADWGASWKRATVDDAAWRDLLRRFREAVETWSNHVKVRADWSHRAASGAIASVAHAAYHLGAIRQILAAQNQNRAPG
jgi:hypothetical protein